MNTLSCSNRRTQGCTEGKCPLKTAWDPLQKRFRSYVETLRIILKKEYATDAAEGGTFPRGTPVFHNEKDGESLVFFVLPNSSSAVRKTERKRNRGSFVLVEKEFGMRVTVLIVLIALVRANAP